MNKIDAVVEILKEWKYDTLIEAWNEYCDNSNNGEESVYPMDSFNDFYCNMSPLDIVSMVEHTNFNSSDDYFAYDGYGRIESFDYITYYSRFEFSELAKYIIDNGDGDLSEDIDRDELISLMYDAMEIGDKIDNKFNYDIAIDALNKFIDENNYDALTDDWDDITGEFIEYIHTEYNDEEDDE
jgi:hypothetical protein